MNAKAQDTTKRATQVKSQAAKPVTVPLATKHKYHYKAMPVANQHLASDTKTVINPMRTEVDPAQLNDKSLRGQYQYLLTKTYNYQQPLIAALWKNVTDTLSAERRKLIDIQAKLAVQDKAVSGLKADVNNKDQALSESNAKTDAISLFGILLPKSTYNLVMCGLAAGLAVALIIVIVTTARYKHEAKYRTELYEEIEDEYKTFKAKAAEKEIKLARELQTERNKVDELLGRG
ncbi:MAG: hypothetical protein ABI203_09355 [Mucilaginibacter sp.]